MYGCLEEALFEARMAENECRGCQRTWSVTSIANDGAAGTVCEGTCTLVVTHLCNGFLVSAELFAACGKPLKTSSTSLIRQRDTEKETKWICRLLVSPPKGLPGWSQEPEEPPGFPAWVAGVQRRGSFALAFPGALARSWVRSRAARSWTGTLIGNAGFQAAYLAAPQQQSRSLIF